jgi:hypothetical protein
VLALVDGCGDRADQLFAIVNPLLEIPALVLLACVLGEASEEEFGIGSSGDHHSPLEGFETHFDGADLHPLNLDGSVEDNARLLRYWWYFAHGGGVWLYSHH